MTFILAGGVVSLRIRIGAIIVSPSHEHGARQIGVDSGFQPSISIALEDINLLASNRAASEQDAKNGQQDPAVLGKHGPSQPDWYLLPSERDAVLTKLSYKLQVCV